MLDFILQLNKLFRKFTFALLKTNFLQEIKLTSDVLYLEKLGLTVFFYDIPKIITIHEFFSFAKYFLVI